MPSPADRPRPGVPQEWMDAKWKEEAEAAVAEKEQAEQDKAKLEALKESL